MLRVPCVRVCIHNYDSVSYAILETKRYAILELIKRLNSIFSLCPLGYILRIIGASGTALILCVIFPYVLQ